MSTTKQTRTMRSAVELALEDLDRAAVRMMVETEPETPRPRARLYRIVGSTIWWPAYTNKHSHRPTQWRSLGGTEIFEIAGGPQRQHAAEVICKAVGWKPNRIAGAVKRLRAAAAWCEARRQGRRRAAQAIIDQSSRAMEALEAIETIAVLRDDENPRDDSDNEPSDIPF